ncbi:MAG: hypothetical protein LUE92_10945 [Clostridiales bacterium]|nr:hypothetical protein [Clostridiales bacterium]
MDEENKKYSEDKPKDCAYCYFWLGKRKGCGLDSCFYLEEEDGQEDSCRDCPYGRVSPCIGYCIRKVLLETKVGQ